MTFLNQLAKTWKQFRWHLVGLWGLYALAASFASVWAGRPYGRYQTHWGLIDLMSLLAPMSALAVSLLVAWSDAPSNPLGYSRTKPWRRGQQALATWTFLVALVVIPLSLASLAAPATLGTPQTWLWALFIQHLLRSCVLLTIPFIASFYTTRLPSAMILMVLLLAPFTWFAIQGQAPALSHDQAFAIIEESPLGASAAFTLGLSQALVAKLIAAFGFVMVLWTSHRRRWLALPAWLSLVALAFVHWPWDMVRTPAPANAHISQGWRAHWDHGLHHTQRDKKVLVQSAKISSLSPDIHAIPWAFHGTIMTASGPLPPSTLRPRSLTIQQPALLVENGGILSTGPALMLGSTTPRAARLKIPLTYQHADFSEPKITEVSGAVETIFLQTKVRARFPLHTRGWQRANGVAFRSVQKDEGDFDAEIRMITVPEPWGLGAIPLEKLTLAIWDPTSQRLLYRSHGPSKRSWVLGQWGHKHSHVIRKRYHTIPIPPNAEWVLFEKIWLGSAEVPFNGRTFARNTLKH